MARLQFDLNDERLKELDRLMQDCGIGTRKELFDNALTLFEWAVREVQGGHTIAAVNEAQKRYRELQMPALNRAAPRRQAAASA